LHHSARANTPVLGVGMCAFADDAVRYVRRFVVSFAGQLACFVALSLGVDKTRSGQNIWRGKGKGERGTGRIDNHQGCFYIGVGF
jgi:hypothetical protein